MRPFTHITFSHAVLELLKHRKRVVLGATLMVAASFLYNAIFFMYGELLKQTFHVPDQEIGLKIALFAVGNFSGAVVLGRLFDKVGRKPMIVSTYAITAILIGSTGYVFWMEYLGAWTLTLALSIAFFFASAGGSAAYLTVSEIFPLEIRSRAIAIFCALAMAIAAPAPHYAGKLIEMSIATGSRIYIFYGFLCCASLMAIGAIIAMLFAVKAEGASLEDIAPPISRA